MWPPPPVASAPNCAVPSTPESLGRLLRRHLLITAFPLALLGLAAILWDLLPATGLADRLAAGAPARAEVIVERGFARTLPGLAACGAVIGGDTGLTHLARALGRPTLTLLGPTTAEDGLWADHPHTLGLDLPCRPCSRFGGARCPVGDHACLRGLRPEAVAAAAAGLGGGP